MRLAIGLAGIYATYATASLQNIDDIFRVQHSANNDATGICDMYVRLKTVPRPVHYRDRPLNEMWEQSFDLAVSGRDVAFGRQNRFTDYLNVQAWFGMRTQPVSVKEATSMEQKLDSERWSLVRDTFNNILEFMTRPSPVRRTDPGPGSHSSSENSDGQGSYNGGIVPKPRLYCNSDGLVYMDPRAIAMDEHGKERTKESSKKPKEGSDSQDQGADKKWTLREWEEEQHGRKDFDDYWWFWNAFSLNRKGYILIPKEQLPVNHGNPNGMPFGSRDIPGAGERPDFCHNWKGPGLTISKTVSQGRPELEVKEDIVILCPQHFTRFAHSPSNFRTYPAWHVQPGTALDELGVNGLTLLAEIIKVSDPVGIKHDHRLIGRDRDVEIDGRRAPDNFWKDSKSATQKRYFKTVDTALATSAAESLYLALYDLAEPVDHDSNSLLAVHTPIAYVWFSLACKVTQRANQRWSSGVLTENLRQTEAGLPAGWTGTAG